MGKPDISKIKYLVKKACDLSEREIAECASLFSANYGHYRDDAPARAGSQIRMSASFFSERYMHEDVNIAMAKAGRYLIGQAIYIRKQYPKIGTMTWILQLVVSEKYRRCGVGSTLLYSIWGMSNDFAWGLATANPCTVKALEGATFRKCDPKYISKNLDKIKLLAGETGFVHEDDFSVNDSGSVVNTRFFVDNSEYLEAYKSISDWKLGNLPAGYEWLAFTFRDQPIDEEKQRKHFARLNPE